MPGYSGQLIYQARFNTSYGDENGEVAVSYQLGSRDAEATEATYRFKLGNEDAWQLIARDETASN